ncbi:MAG TPA: thioredoxin TrxA [Steroidobacteraceae bacterium]|nr:thioredoxin TrxA [Steroidobacteraceae bacterium]
MSETTARLPIQTTDASFDSQVLQAKGAVLVDYWAEWCGPCKMIAPLLEAGARDYAGRLSIAKLNVDENPLTATRFHVRSIPTLMLFRNGQPVATRVGALTRAQLGAFIETHL